MITPFLALLLATGAAAPGTQPVASDQIVITGIRPADAKTRLDACLARKCPPLEEMAAALEYAEALFVAGDYRKANGVLSRTLDRHHDEAVRYPNAVAGLYRALAQVSIHEGDGAKYRQSAYGVIRSLKAGLPANDPRILGATIEAAEMHASLREFDSAERLYKAAAAKARLLGRPDIAATADLRRAVVAHRQGRPEGRRQMEAIARIADPRLRVQQLAARILLARMDRDAGKTDTSDQLLAELAKFGFRKPTLIYAPPIDLPSAASTASYVSMGGGAVENRTASTSTPMEGFDYWADIGFWVTPEGRVEDAEILRSKGPKHWLAPVLRSVTGRIYAPGKGGVDPSYRVERFTYTSLLERRTGTRTASHSAQGRIESVDITADEQAAERPQGRP